MRFYGPRRYPESDGRLVYHLFVGLVYAVFLPLALRLRNAFAPATNGRFLLDFSSTCTAFFRTWLALRAESSLAIAWFLNGIFHTRVLPPFRNLSVDNGREACLNQTLRHLFLLKLGMCSFCSEREHNAFKRWVGPFHLFR